MFIHGFCLHLVYAWVWIYIFLSDYIFFPHMIMRFISMEMEVSPLTFYSPSIVLLSSSFWNWCWGYDMESEEQINTQSLYLEWGNKKQTRRKRSLRNCINIFLKNSHRFRRSRGRNNSQFMKKRKWRILNCLLDIKYKFKENILTSIKSMEVNKLGLRILIS
jgi:hypothetical protein